MLLKRSGLKTSRKCVIKFVRAAERMLKGL